jgi:hypothetical protein
MESFTAKSNGSPKDFRALCYGSTKSPLRTYSIGAVAGSSVKNFATLPQPSLSLSARIVPMCLCETTRVQYRAHVEAHERRMWRTGLVRSLCLQK